jgi:hypothetical protein
MNDTLKNPSRDWVLKLYWPSDAGVQASGERIVVELQDSKGLMLGTLSVPSDQLLQAVAQKLEGYPILSPHGFVSLVSDEITETLSDRAIAVDQLVAEAISPDMLDDEQNVVAMLYELRARLLKSIEYVDQAHASLQKPPT